MSIAFIAWPVRLGLVISLGGCAALPEGAPVVDAGFGDTVRQAQRLQTGKVDAGRTARESGDFDAQSAVNAIQRHRDGFKAPPPSFTVLGIGGSGGAAP